ncbi:uncharacterized protein LOC108706543 [Xenopus laevis]|uniref:Uncharacterized protein LOC108706543 n=1 Tax=Xenopus laevis TaxID=8355 RepID=A0A8J0TZU4_XENLA|nr:uncharacterized protein LOC108706543 [Xenopus laevis]
MMALWEVQEGSNNSLGKLLPKLKRLFHSLGITEASLYHLFNKPIPEAAAPEANLETMSIDDLCQFIQTFEEKVKHFHSVIQENTPDCSSGIISSFPSEDSPLTLGTNDNNICRTRRATDSDSSLNIARLKRNGQYYCQVCWTKGHVPQQSTENTVAQARLTIHDIYDIIKVLPKEATVHVGRLLNLTDDQVEKCMKDEKEDEVEKLYRIIREREKNGNPTKQQIVLEIEEALMRMDYENSLNKLRRICCNNCKRITS